MSSRSILAFVAVVALVGCHRRTFEKEAPRGEVIVTSTTVITNADVPDEEPQPAPAAAMATPASPAAPATDAPHLFTETFRSTDEPVRKGGATEEPASAPASPRERADRVPWGGDSHSP